MDAEKKDPVTCMRRAVWGMLHAADAKPVSRSSEGHANMVAIIRTVFEITGSIGTKLKDGFATSIGLEPPRSTACHRSSMSEVNITAQCFYLL